MRPESYHLQDGCHNCRHMVPSSHRADYNSGCQAWFCAVAGVPVRKVWYEAESVTWQGREVEPFGMCARWRVKCL